MHIFSSHPILVEGISPAYLATLLKMHAEEGFSGLFHLTLKDSQAVFFLAHGKTVLSYLYQNGMWEAVIGGESDSLVQRLRGDLRVLRFSPLGLRLMRLYLEEWEGGQSQANDHPATELPIWLREAFQRWGDGILSLEGKQWSGLVLTYPNEASTSDVVAWNANSCQSGLMALNSLYKFGDPRYNLVYQPIKNKNSVAWQEYLLYRAVQNFVQMMLQQFQSFAGRAVLLHLGENLSRLLAREHLNFRFQDGLFFHEHFFPSLKEAERAYRSLLHLLHSTMSLIIGEGLYRQAAEKGLKRLPVAEQEVFRRLSEPPIPQPASEMK